MITYLRAEFYKIWNRKCAWVFLALGIFGSLFINFMLRISRMGESFPNKNISLMFAIEIMIQLGWFLVLAIMNIEHTNESRNSMLKNTVSFGINRTKVYFYRFITEALLMAFMVLVYGVIYFICSRIFLGSQPITGDIMSDYIKIILLCYVLWLGALALGHMMAMNMNSGSAVSTIFCLVFMMYNTILQGLGLLFKNSEVISDMIKWLLDVSLKSNIGKLMGDSISGEITSNVIQCGLVHMALFLVIGYVIYRKKEIK
ncbi:membrane spanning protein [Lachnospiraceae bacterium KM106-2]|nr:membrane spanning protein [Lachnospiraceae bacterium KM106-2]